MDRAATEAGAQALGDLRHIATDMLSFHKDTGTWPQGGSFAFTDGTAAIAEAARLGGNSPGQHMSSFLATNARRVPNWRGPYMTVSRPDPWGNRYVVVLEGIHKPADSRAWVISAGPDGTFQTTSRDRELRGDDLGLLLR